MEATFSSNVRRLERQLKEIRSERDAFEKKISTYAQENAVLKDQVAQLHSKFTDSDSKAVKVLKEIQTQHKQLTDLREEEYVTTLEEKETKIKTLQERIRQLKLDVDKFKESEKENKSWTSKNNVKVSALEEKISKLDKENKQKDELLSSTKSSLEQNNDKLSSQYRVRIRVLEDQLKTSRFESEQANSDLAKTKLNFANEQNKAQSELSKINTEMKLLQNQMKTMKGELKEKEHAYNQVSQKMTSQKNDQDSINSKQRIQMKILEDKIRNLKQELQEKDNEIFKINKKATNQQNTTDSLTGKLQAEVSAYKDEVEELQKDLKEKNSQLNKISLQLSSSESSKNSSSMKHETKVRTLTDEIEELKSKLKVKDSEICSLANSMLSLEKRDEKTSSKYIARLERLQKDFSDLSKENDLKDIKLKKSKREVNRLESECKSLTSQHRIQVDSLEEEVANLRCESREKEERLCRISSKLSSFENESESSNLKQQTHTKVLVEKLSLLEKEMKRKDEELCAATAQLNSQQMEVQTSSSQQRTKLRMLEEKVIKLTAENKNKEDQLCKVSSKLAHSELEADSVASSYRVKVCALKDKLSILQTANEEKEAALIALETKTSQSESQFQSLKEKVKRLEMESERKEKELGQLQSIEWERASKSTESSSQLKSLQRDRRRLELEKEKLASDLQESERNLSSVERDLTGLKSAISRKDKWLETIRESEEKLKDEISSKSASEKHLKAEIQSLHASNEQLMRDLEHTNTLKQNLVGTVEDLSEKLTNAERQRKILEDDSTTASKLQTVRTEQNKIIEHQKKMMSNLRDQFDDVNEQLVNERKENKSLEEKLKSLSDESDLRTSLESQLDEYKSKLDQMQKINSQLVDQQETTLKEHRVMCRKVEKFEEELKAKASKTSDYENMVTTLKETCLLLEKQVEDLECFNNQLIEKQNGIAIERDEALTNCSELKQKLSSSKHQLKAELFSLDQSSSDQITELKIELRSEMNKLHEVTEENRNLERKYKNLELNTAALQRKFAMEKEVHERSMDEVHRLRADQEVLHQSMKRMEQNLHMELDRCDALEREKTQMQNKVDTEKLDFSHELMRLNCQGAQQAKLIDFLQSRVEELEPTDKKKKKKKTTLYQAPLQYRELCDLLEEEKSSNVRLQEQVNSLRSELQATNSKVKRMKHGMETPLSPGSIAAITAIVKSPVCSSVDGATSPKSGKLRSKPRMHHNIPHRLSSWVCHKAIRCSVCLATVYFGHSALKCSECSVVCHTKCRKSITNTCGLPGGLFQQFKEGAKSAASPITCVFKGTSSDQFYGKLKVLCGDDSWVLRSVRISSSHIRIAPPNAKSPSRVSDKDDVIDLTQAAFIQTDISQSELPSTSKMDLSYAFKVQTGASNSCWPARSVYFLAAGYAEKHLWVQKLEDIAVKHNQTKHIAADAKILGNEILALLSDEKLEMNCSLPISNKTTLFGCDEGLFLLSPSTSSLSSRSDMRKVEGVSSVFQMVPIGKTQVLAIEGQKHRLVSLDVSSVERGKASLQSIEEMQGCHLFSVGQAEGLYYLCVASASNITLLKYNDKLKKFCKRKEIVTTEPCTCMVFTACSVIIGTSTFYEIDLTDFKTDGLCPVVEDLDQVDVKAIFVSTFKNVLSRHGNVLSAGVELAFFRASSKCHHHHHCCYAAYTLVNEFIDDEEVIATSCDDGSVFPVSILKIKQRRGKQEFLLCFHEFGVFVDGFGRQTRSGRITWPRMPLAFEYRDPYLVIIQFNSVTIIRIDVDGSSSAESASLDQAYLSFPSARYLGSAITEGAIYLSSTSGNKTSVFCCKGNMKSPNPKMSASSTLFEPASCRSLTRRNRMLDTRNVKIQPYDYMTSFRANKRQHRALAASCDSLAGPSIKRSVLPSDVSSISSTKASRLGSTQSIGSDTSRWVSSVEDTEDDCYSTVTRSTIDSDMTSSASEESASYQQETNKIQWRSRAAPTKPSRKRQILNLNDYDPVPSTQV